MHLLEVSNPVAQQRGMMNIFRTNPRPESLDGLTVGLVWSGTHGGDSVSYTHLPLPTSDLV